MNNFKDDFKWYKNNPKKVFFDSAAGTLKPDVVIEKIVNYYQFQSTNPHNDDSLFTYHAKEIMNKCRGENAKLINADDQEIIFTSGATESLMLVAQSIKHKFQKGDEIILTRIEHASNLLPWYELRDELGIVIKFVKEDGLNIDINNLKELLNVKTKLVSFTGGSNLTGILTDIEEISKTIKSYNKDIYVCVDLAQRMAHLPVDVKKCNIDFAAYSGNKIFGPTGIGVCYIKKELQNIINPLRYGGGMNSTITEKDFCYIDGVEKFEGGTPNVAGIYGLLEAINYINKIGYKTIKSIEEENYNYFKKKFSENQIEGLKWINEGYQSSIYLLKFDGIFSQDLAHYLGSNNIIVRSGLSCAKLMKDVINDVGAVRISTSIYNTKEDIDILFDVLKNFRKEKILDSLI